MHINPDELSTMVERLYVLDGNRKPVHAESFDAWCLWRSKATCVVAQTEIGDFAISTVFLGVDHNHADGPPLLFETAIFGLGLPDIASRCSTWQQAEAQHAEICARYRKQ